MSPAKPISSIQLQRQRAIPNKTDSAIPRRVRSMIPVTGAKSKTKTTKSSADKDSIFNDSTSTVRPTQVTSYFANPDPATEDKENIGVPRFRAILDNGSPTKGNAGVSKPSKLSPSKLTKSALARRPLRELTKEEIFERDEATLGDLRRRRSGEHSGTYIEFDSRIARTSSSTASVMHASSVLASTAPLQSTVSTDVDDSPDGRIRVYEKNDIAESLKKVEAIMAGTLSATPDSASKSKARKTLHSPLKEQHPAVRTTSPKPSSRGLYNSPERKAIALSPSRSSGISRRSPSAVVKSSPSVRPARVGLGIKGDNMLLNEATKATAGNGKKFIITTDAEGDAKKKPLTKKRGTSSLRRAAGAARPPSMMPGLESIRRMR